MGDKLFFDLLINNFITNSIRGLARIAETINFVPCQYLFLYSFGAIISN